MTDLEALRAASAAYYSRNRARTSMPASAWSAMLQTKLRTHDAGVGTLPHVPLGEWKGGGQ